MNAAPLELAGLIAASAAAAAALLLHDPRRRRAAMALALLLAPVLVLGDVWDQPRVAELRESPLRLTLGLAVAAASIAALLVLFRRRPDVFPVIAVAVVALRVPVEVGDETANLLVPLYLVIAARVLAAILAGAATAPAARPPVRGERALRVLLALFLILYAVQAAYSEDVSNAVENVGFFHVPFAVLLALLAELAPSRELVRRLAIAVAAVAAVAAAIGLGQHAARELFLNPELFDANQLHQYFRVNSLFFDPNIFGRYLALTLVALAACLAFSGARRELLATASVAALALAALALSYSITSLAALLAGLGVLALLHFGWRGAAAAGGFGLAALAALVVVGGAPTSDIQTDRGIDSGRVDLVEGGLQLAGFAEAEVGTSDVGRPLTGYGSGSFGAAFYERIERARTTVSHSEPITIAAEQGLLGLIPYLALLAVAFAVVLGDSARSSGARSAVAACFVAIVVHSLGYAGFLTDPATWVLLGLAIALRHAPAPGAGPSGGVDGRSAAARV